MSMQSTWPSAPARRTVAVPVRSGPTDDGVTARQASHLLWWSLAFFLISFGAGTAWDRAWHATHPFDDFYSPPHLFIYTNFAIAALLFARLAFSRDRCAWYGATMRVPVLARDIPAAVVLAGAGFATIGLAGMLDDVWHTNFGLDETNWSTPHAMLGWGILLTWLGFISCRLVLRDHIAVSRPFMLFAGVLSLGLATNVVLGALGRDATPDMVRQIAALPVLAREEPAQHSFRILLKWNLTRTSPLFVPASALAAGLALSFVRGLSRNTRWFLAIAALATLFATTSGHRQAAYFGIQDDARNWLPVPFIVAALAFAGAKWLHRGDVMSWAVAGLAFGVVVAAWWGNGGALALAAVPAMALGAAAGQRLYAAIEHPSATSVRALAAIAVVMPALLGAVDLWLRSHTA